MAALDAAQFQQDLQDAGGGAMDTTPIQQSLPPDLSSSFLTSLSAPLPDPSMQNHLLQEPSSVFLNKPDHPNGLVASMHMSMPDLPASAFMSPMEAVDSAAPLIHTAPAGFIADMTHPDPFTMVSPLENGMDMSQSSVSLSSSSQSQSQVPSPSIHGLASAYGVGVTSSLESALDPVGVAGGRSRANTSVSPTTLPSSFISMSPPSQQAMSVSFPASEAIIAKQEDFFIVDLFSDIAKTAVSAGDHYKNRHAVECSHKVDELKERISQVSEMIAMMSVVPKFTPSLPPQGPVVPIADQQNLGFPAVVPVKTSAVDIHTHLNVADHSRKRCASELEEQRTVKAPKREPQEDLPLSFPPPVESPPIPAPVETSPLFPTTVIPLPQAATLPPTTTPSQPPSRASTPPSGFGPHSTYPPLKSQAPIVAPYPPFVPSSAPIDFGTSISPTLPSTSPTFPSLHTSWTENVVPTTRHHHSSSVGSINGSLQVLPPLPAPNVVTNAMDPFASQPILPAPSQLAPIVPTVATVSQPIGRMSRSGSINGAPYTNGSFSYGYMPPDTTGNWSSIGRTINTAPAPSIAQSTWYVGNAEAPRSSVSPPTSDAPGTMPSTARNSPSDDEGDDDDGDSDDNDTSHAKNTTRTASGDAPANSSSSDVPQEYRTEVDRIFFEYLNKICSNLEATDSKGEPIHQTLMAKKMQRLDESPDFRPFKFRIQAFTLAFLEELARQGYPEEKIPMKKIRNYLWRQQYILRYNEDGKKAKSKGNHIWNIEAKKAGDGKWEFRPFHRKLAGTPPGVAYCGLKWTWTPRIWDPQASWQNVPVQYTSPNLPAWLTWKDDVLSGIPPPDAESCQITVNAKFVLDGQEGHLSHIFQLTIAPVSTLDTTSFSRSRRPSLVGEIQPPRRSTSDSALFQAPQRSKARAAAAAAAATVNSPDTRVIQVLQNVAQRVSEEAQSQFVSVSPPQADDLQDLADLAKQKHVLEQTVEAYDKEISGQGHSQTRQLAVAAQNVVVQAAHTVIADRTIATGVLPVRQTETAAIQSVTVNELTDATQDAIAMAVKSQGTASTEVDIIVAATSILKARTPLLDTSSSNVLQQPRSHSMGSVPTMHNPAMISGYPTSNLAPLPEYS